MAQDHSPVGAHVSTTPTMAGQGTPSHYRLTRKLRGMGSDLSAHHLGLPGSSGLSGGGTSGGFSRESLHGSKEKLMANNHQNHMHSPMMRETTPVFSIKEGE